MLDPRHIQEVITSRYRTLNRIFSPTAAYNKTTPARATVEVAEEPPGPDEDKQIDKITALLRKSMKRQYSKKRPALRKIHAKTHGVVEAKFQIEPDLPRDTQYGVFQPKATYNAWIRFSNASPKDKADKKRGGRGMAIKLIGIEEQLKSNGIEAKRVLADSTEKGTQDFVLTNAPIFFIPDVAEALAFFRATIRFGEWPGRLVYALCSPRSRVPRLLKMRKALARVTNPLTSTYWSSVPYRLGHRFVKYTVRPAHRDGSSEPGSSPNFLREAMVDHLSKYDARFDFMVQFQTDPSKTPLEDSTIEWDESDSPPVKVATITIPRQVFNTTDRMNFGEHLSFSPWHSLEDHRPAGSINRIRKATYVAMSELRHNMNHVRRTEPLPVTTQAPPGKKRVS
jgi:hypothetical protein